MDVYIRKIHYKEYIYMCVLTIITKIHSIAITNDTFFFQKFTYLIILPSIISTFQTQAFYKYKDRSGNKKRTFSSINKERKKEKKKKEKRNKFPPRGKFRLHETFRGADTSPPSPHTDISPL